MPCQLPACQQGWGNQILSLLLLLLHYIPLTDCHTHTVIIIGGENPNPNSPTMVVCPCINCVVRRVEKGGEGEREFGWLLLADPGARLQSIKKYRPPQGHCALSFSLWPEIAALVCQVKCSLQMSEHTKRDPIIKSVKSKSLNNTNTHRVYVCAKCVSWAWNGRGYPEKLRLGITVVQSHPQSLGKTYAGKKEGKEPKFCQPHAF